MTHSYPTIRLFVESALAADGEVTLSGDQAHYLARVMRLKAGDDVALFNGRDGEWRAIVTQTGKKSMILRVGARLRAYLPPPDIWLLFAPLKFGRIDYLAQKATELGVARLQPVFTQYTQAERVNLERLRANAVEAAEQCERVEVPEIAEPIDLPRLLEGWPPDRLLLYADESGESKNMRELLLSPGKRGKYALLIGPEGGFSDRERPILRSKGIGVGLGPRILRADTAALALLAIIQCAWGDWDRAPRFKQQGD